ncbi:sensor histidine kinase [Pseudidiomarina terrestris]|uniref:sensor histidine kinase n=1 Tax=Pseudidiomarina terrestris TaxID=2820060 RepID=UPI00265A0BB3|nr:ATP-binding protein [Pseudidiomarina sp. 1APR75-33.1]
MTKRYILQRVASPSWQRAFLFYLVLPLLALSGAAIGVALEQAREFQDERLRDDLELVGRAIRLPLSDALLSDDIARVQAHLDAVFEIGRVYGASVYDTNGELVAAAGVTERDLSESLLAEQVVLTGEQRDSYREVAGRDVFSQFIPVNDRAGRLIGFMQLNRRAEDFEQSFSQLERIAWVSWSIVALALVSILGLGYYRTRRQQQLEISTRLREHEKMAAIGQLSRGVAHELGAPLTVIAGRAKRLQERHTDAESQRQLSAIRGQVERLTKLVQQLLDFSRTPISQPQPVSLAALIQQAANAVQHEQTDRAPDLILDLPTPELRVHADGSRLELALVNLLRNALQAAAAQVRVDVKTTGSERCVIVVSDDGPGLPQSSTTEQLVEPFTTTKPIGEGTGLGLAIVAHIIDAHAGRFTLQNRPEGGCEARVLLPCEITKES